MSAPRPLRCFLVVLLFGTMNAPLFAWAQASLAAEDMIDEIPVTIEGSTDRFTVVRDAVQKEQWYYVPPYPRLSERAGADGAREPEFTLVRYQAKDPANPEKLLEGGFLQFAMSLAIPPEAIDQLKAAIAKARNVPAPSIRLAALPFKSATANLYVPKSGELIASEPIGPGIAPTFATQKIAYSIALKKLGSDVYDTLANGPTGLGVGVEFTYTGLTPPVGFTVTVDWDQAYSFYSRQDRLEAGFAVAGYFGAKANVDKQKLVEQLKQNKVIHIDQIDDEGNSAKYLEMVLNRINAEILAAMTPPAAVEEAKAADPGHEKDFLDKLTKSYTGSVGYSVAIKDRKQVKSGKEEFRFTARKLQERKTVAAGFVGIGRYPEELRKRLVTVVPPGPWKSAFFVLPNVGDAKEIGISQVDLEIRLRQDGAIRKTQAVQWKPTTGWIGIESPSAPRSVVAFGLMDLYHADPKLSKVDFQTTARITLKNDVLNVSETIPVDDERAIVTPLSNVKVIHLDATSISWKGLAPDGKVVSANVTVRAGDRAFTTLLKPRMLDAQKVPPAPIAWVVPRSAESVVADVKFRLADGKTVAWPRNGENLAAEQVGSGDLFIELLDSDVPQPPPR